MPYLAQHTGRLTCVGVPNSTAKARHEIDTATGDAVCGRPFATQSTWRGHPASLPDDGPAIVDCWHCEQRQTRLSGAAS
jgi:hypothetical protein